jgi:hypothetical protein
LPSKSPNAAVNVALDRLRRIAACITDRPVFASGYRASPEPHHFSFAPLQRDVPLRTRHGSRRVLLTMKQEYAVDHDEGRRLFEVRTTGYSYRLLDREGREILAYHWHPVGISPITFPHLHLTRFRPIDLSLDSDPLALAEMHLPTGFGTLEDIVRLLITEFAVEPRRSDWAEILAAVT